MLESFYVQYRPTIFEKISVKNTLEIWYFVEWLYVEATDIGLYKCML